MMKKTSTFIKSILVLSLVLGLSACSKSSGPPPAPGVPLLTFPQESSECTTGIDQGVNNSQVTFQWQPADNATTYTLRIQNLNTFQNLGAIITDQTSAAVVLKKGVPYTWNVTASSTESEETATSSSWSFYNAGAQTTYAPFPASLDSPVSGATVIANASGQVNLDWSSNGDVDGDLLTYEIRLSTSNPPDVLTTQSASFSDLDADVTSGNTYFWQVISIDQAGNRAESQIKGFRVQ